MGTVGVSEIEELQGSLRGALLLPGEAQYDDARKIWNAMIDKRPAMIVRCAGAADVRARSISHASTACGWRCAAAATTSRAAHWSTTAW